MRVIIGAGLSGLSAAYHMGSSYRVLEKEAEVGGLCRSVATRGYTFDLAPHIFFTGSQYVNGLVNEILNGDLIKQQRRAYIYLSGTYVEYPFEVNLHGLPQEVIDECIEGPAIDRRYNHVTSWSGYSRRWGRVSPSTTWFPITRRYGSTLSIR